MKTTTTSPAGARLVSAESITLAAREAEAVKAQAEKSNRGGFGKRGCRPRPCKKANETLAANVELAVHFFASQVPVGKSW